MSVPSRTLCLTQGNSLVLHCASLLRTIFASSARAHELMHVQIVRDFPQTKLDNGINSPFLLNELGDPRFFFQVFARNSLMKNIFEEEKKFDSRTQFFFWKMVPNWVYFGQGEDLKLTKKLSEKVQYCRNQAIKNGLNEAILPMSINEALLFETKLCAFQVTKI